MQIPTSPPSRSARHALCANWFRMRTLAIESWTECKDILVDMNDVKLADDVGRYVCMDVWPRRRCEHCISIHIPLCTCRLSHICGLTDGMQPFEWQPDFVLVVIVFVLLCSRWLAHTSRLEKMMCSSSGGFGVGIFHVYVVCASVWMCMCASISLFNARRYVGGGK